jgi:hypothetical protein
MMVGSFLKSGFKISGPTEPSLAVYERGSRNPVIRIDGKGRIWPHKLKWNGEFAPAVEMSRILYANVPVPIPTEWGFVLVPLSRAGDGTGPAEAQPEGEDPGRSEK